MTIYEIAKMALTHLEYGTDDDAMAQFIDRFTLYINDAARIIADNLHLTKTETVTLTDDHFNVDDLSHDSVTKIEEIIDPSNSRRAYAFVEGDELGDFKVIHGKHETLSSVNVRYRYLPSYVADADKAPDCPAVFHPIMYLYVVHCHHNSRANASDYDRTKWLQEFERQRKIVTRSYGALNQYVFKNRPWETGEM